MVEVDLMHELILTDLIRRLRAQPHAADCLAAGDGRCWVDRAVEFVEAQLHAAAETQQGTCGRCRYWRPRLNVDDRGRCEQSDVLAMLSDGASFWPDASFACALFESKK